jgi:hypothetical protein
MDEVTESLKVTSLPAKRASADHAEISLVADNVKEAGSLR